MTKAALISRQIKDKGLRICIAESFTGGGIASELVKLQGASEIFTLGAVCYANEAKMKILGVNSRTLDTFGAVSEQTVSEMLDGLKRLGLGEIMLATSGNAGPTSEKPEECGLFYLGVMYNDKKIIRRYKVDGDRSGVIARGIEESFDLVSEILKTK